MWQRLAKLSPNYASRRAVSVLLRFGLIVSLWQAPVPWMHSHDELNLQTAKTGFWLDHFGRFHSQSLAAETQGWHWHFVLPWELTETHEGEGTSSDSPPASFCVDSATANSTGLMSLLADDESRTPEWSFLRIGRTPQANLLVRSRPIGVQVLLAYSNRISWRILSGVAHC